MKYLEVAWSSCIDIKADCGIKSHVTAALFLFEADSLKGCYFFRSIYYSRITIRLVV
jgi:hypothetical protein